MVLQVNKPCRGHQERLFSNPSEAVGRFEKCLTIQVQAIVDCKCNPNVIE